MPLKRIKLNDLTLDQPLHWDLLDAEGELVFNRGQLLEQGPALTRLLELGLYRNADTAGDNAPAPVSLAQMLLSPGDMLQLQASGSASSGRHPVRLIGYHSPVSLLVTAPEVNGRLVFIKEGQYFLVRGFVGQDAVAYSTRVLKSNLSPFAYMHLAWPEEVQTIRIRSSARVPVGLVCAIIHEQGQSSARVIDLSPGGARIVSGAPLGNTGDQIRLAFRINPGGAEVYLKLQAVIRGTVQEEDKYTTGVEFIDVSEADNLYLSNMVYQHLLKERL